MGALFRVLAISGTVLTWLSLCECSFLLEKFRGNCNDEPAFCRFPGEYEASRCLAATPRLCNGITHVGNNSTCQLLRKLPSLYTCTNGVWTYAGDRISVQHRERRSPLGFISSAIGIVKEVVCFFICSDPEPPPPPHPPTFTSCPTSIDVTAPAGKDQAQASWAVPTAKDDDGESPSVTLLSGKPPGSYFKEGDTQIMYKARDSTGLTDYCFFIISVTVVYCPAIAYSSHRLHSCWQDKAIYGSTCTFTCEDGYFLNGTGGVSCQSDSRWSPSPFPTCLPKSCGQPGSIEGGSFSCPLGIDYPDMCINTCNSGYQNTGLPYIMCTQSGIWTQRFPCADAEPPKFRDGCPLDIQTFSGPLKAPVSVTWQDPIVTDNSGLNVTLSSNPSKGSSFSPSQRVVRLYATDATGNTASCFFFVTVSVKECQQLTAPDNGRLTCSSGYVEGSMCTVSCSQGYVLVGSATLTCTSIEQWNTSMPTCEAITCADVPVVPHGLLECSGQQKYLDTCSLTCDSGFRLVNRSYVQCDKNGSWTNAGSCRDIEPPVFVNGCPMNVEVSAARLGGQTIAKWSPPDVTDNSGDQVVLISDKLSGSAFPIGLTQVTYTASDPTGNKRSCSFSVSVTTLACPVPDLELPNRNRTLMTYTCPNGTVYGASCTINCTHGYPLVGPSTIVCERDDTTSPITMFWDWPGPSAAKPECIVTVCPDLLPPKNGALACFLGNFGWDCLMSCNAAWDVPARTDGHFYCTNSVGFWIPSTVPNCVVVVRPGSVRLLSDVFYYTDTCEASKESLKLNFISRMNNSTWRDACINVPLCTTENVQVTCGSVSKKRAASYAIVKFEIVMSYEDSNRTAQQIYQSIDDKRNDILQKLAADLNAGHFDMPGFTLDEFGFSYPRVLPDCPPGTMFVERQESNTLTCSGCGKGYYLPSGATKCQVCPVGTYTDTDNATSCDLCAEGWSTLSNASQSRNDCQKLCEEGFFSTNGLQPCQPCPPGQYQSQNGSVACTYCPAGTWTAKEESKSIDQCLPADAYLTKQSLSAIARGQGSSLTLRAWLYLTDNASVILSFKLGVNVFVDLEVRVFTDDSMLPVKTIMENGTRMTSFKVESNAWTRLLLALDLPNANFYYNDSLVLSLDQLTSTTCFVNMTATSGEVRVSGLRAEDRLMSPQEIHSSPSSCWGNNSGNLLTWSHSQSLMSTPSVCDAVDDCVTQPCGRHTCENTPSGFVCHCKDGWRGERCSTPPDPCDVNDCRNNSTCVSAGEHFTCSCTGLYTGDRCEREIIHGEWGEWSVWTTCNVTCNGGLQQRQRQCNNPTPQNGGNTCTGRDAEIVTCNDVPCPLNGGWSTWSEWTSCSTSCAGGERTRVRKCDNPAPLYNGTGCEGPRVESVVCSTDICPIHGSWGPWSVWSECSVSCGNGQSLRQRYCDSPPPSNGGSACEGNSSEIRSCFPVKCPVCATLYRSFGTHLDCSERTSPYLKSCNLTCIDGYFSTVVFPQYTCGAETGYLWNHQRDSNSSVALPACSIPKSPVQGEMTQNVTMNVAYDEVTAQTITAGITQNMQALPCVQEAICTVNVSAPSSQVTRGKRSSSNLKVNFLMTVNFGPSLELDKNNTENLEKILTLYLLAEESAARVSMNLTSSLFSVTVGNQVITPDLTSVSYKIILTCPSGTARVQDICVDCPVGTKEIAGKCLRCELGEYQDQPGSTTCKLCPAGLSWDVLGATDVTQCLLPYEVTSTTASSTSSATPDLEHSTQSNISVIIGASCGAALLVALIAGIIIYIKTQMTLREGKYQKRGSIFSLTSTNTIRPAVSQPPPYWAITAPGKEGGGDN